MQGYTISTYGDRWADDYDTWHPAGERTRAAVAYLSDLAGKGPALELGIGTGRIGAPLSAQGVDVHGVEASERMIDRLREKAGGERIRIFKSDLATMDLERSYMLIYAVLGTISCLLTQAELLECLGRIVRYLEPNGVLVLETFDPALHEYSHGQRAATLDLAVDEVNLDASLLNAEAQTITVQRVAMSATGIRFFPLVYRYVSLAELDAMCRLAGLRLRARWGGWSHEPPTNGSGASVSEFVLAAQSSGTDPPGASRVTVH